MYIYKSKWAHENCVWTSDCGHIRVHSYAWRVPRRPGRIRQVPFADVTCLKIPDSVPDEKALYLSDVVCTSYWATECADVGEGDVVGIWGAGPIGALAAQWAVYRKASRVIVIDNVPERLELVRNHVKCETINFSQVDVIAALKSLIPQGLDCSIDAVGFRYPKTWLHYIERTMYLETDSPDVLVECFTCTRPFGRVALVGDYVGYCNHFPIGQVMEKALTLKGGQCPVQRFWRELLQKMVNNEFDPSWIISHRISLGHIPAFYEMFHLKQLGAMKCFVRV